MKYWKKMKIAIISDSHDNLTNLGKFLSFLKREKINFIIHCGDVCNGETLRKIRKDFSEEIFLSFGNADIRESFVELKENPKIKFFEDFGEMEIDNLKIGFCHDSNLAKKTFETKKYDFVFYGHTHRPSLKEKNGHFLANPGNLSGLFFKATFAILDTKTKILSLKILEKIEKGS